MQRLDVRDDLLPFGRVVLGIHHGTARRDGLGVGQPGVEQLFIPDLAGHGFAVAVAVGEVLACGLATDQPEQVRPLPRWSALIEGVTDRAMVGRQFLRERQIVSLSDARQAHACRQHQQYRGS